MDFKMKNKALFILHRSPPHHGAAKVGDFISTSKIINDSLFSKFITIKSSNSIKEIGHISLSKIFNFVFLYFSVLFFLISHRPNKIYFTASVRGVAFYRDLILSSLWKFYSLFHSVDIYYHYHTKGFKAFYDSSHLHATLSSFFLNKVNVIILDPSLKCEYETVDSIASVAYLPNGVPNPLVVNQDYLMHKYNNDGKVNVIYISNMIKSKGYLDVLKLALYQYNRTVHFHFAGGWENERDEQEFYDFIEVNHLQDRVTFHGFVFGEEKDKLFKMAHLFVFPTRYHNEVFPLSILESLSYGVPVISTNEGAIPSILDKNSGVIITNNLNLQNEFILALTSLVNCETGFACYTRFLNEFDVSVFEEKFLRIIST